MDVLIRENFFLQNRIAMIEKELEQAKLNLRFKEQGQHRERDIQTFYVKENVILMESPEVATDIDTTYGVSTINVSEYSSKVSQLSESGAAMIPRTLEVGLKESNDTQPFNESTGLREYFELEGVNLSAVFDQNKNTFWTRTVSYPRDKGVTEIYGIMEIKLPLEYLTDVFSNTLTINPYPEYSMDILDITYKGYGDQWYRLPNFPTEEDGDGNVLPVSFKEASKLIFTFPHREITEVQIHFRQPYWFKNGDNRDFVYGFQDINIENRVYNNETAEFVSVYSLEGTTKSFEMIRPPLAIPAIGSEQNLDGLITHQLYYDRNLTNEATFGNRIMADIKKVYVKTTMRRAGDNIPVLKELHLDYDYKDSEQ
jgi:hypothetical protein